MKVLIIEDELPAQAKLEEMIKTLDPGTTVLAKLGSVKESLVWLGQNPPPDLAFVDIQLSDDHSFEIFKKYPVNFPVIFTTAYDKYMLQSFEFNSIDYLLKPITEEKLKRSFEKIKNLEQHFVQGSLLKFINQSRQTPARNRIVVRKGAEFITLDINDVAYFYTEHKIVFVRDFSGRQFIVDKNLAELESELDPVQFFRVNRKYFVNLRAIERFRPDNGKIQVFLKPEMKEDVHVSKETAPQFRKWVGADR